MGQYDIDAETKLLLHFSGSTIIDSSPSTHSVSSTGTVNTSTLQEKFAPGALKISGSNTFINCADDADWDFGSGDFTLDTWIYYTGTPNKHVFWASRYPTTTAIGIDSWYESGDPGASQGLNFAYSTNGTNTTTFNASEYHTPSASEWTHIAFVRNEATFSMYRNGISLGDYDMGTDTIFNSTNIFRFFGSDGPPGAYVMQGYADEMRVSKGVARWTENFTPPEHPYGWTPDTIQNLQMIL